MVGQDADAQDLHDLFWLLLLVAVVVLPLGRLAIFFVMRGS